MISIIICSVRAEELKKIGENISDTIGTEYELVVIDNSNRRYGICEAYNRGAMQARGDYLCFMHEDILFETKDWGLAVHRHFSDPSLGMIGIAGGSAKPLVPSGWSPVIFNSEIHLVQHHKHSGAPPQPIHKTHYPHNTSRIQRVMALDGVWLCLRREVFEHFQFDAERFPGFHGYDIDYSLQAGRKFQVAVVSDILLHHYSEGNYDRGWLESAMAVSKKWKELLPAAVDPLPKEKLVTQHWSAMKIFIRKMKELNYPRNTITARVLKYSLNRYFHPLHFFSCLRLISQQDRPASDG